MNHVSLLSDQDDIKFITALKNELTRINSSPSLRTKPEIQFSTTMNGNQIVYSALIIYELND